MMDNSLISASDEAVKCAFTYRVLPDPIISEFVILMINALQCRSEGNLQGTGSNATYTQVEKRHVSSEH